MKLIESTGQGLRGRHAVVIGRSNTVGKPMALLLLQANATVTICHSGTPDLARHTREADIVVCHLGLTTGGSIGAETALKLKDCPAKVDAWAEAASWLRR